MKQPHHILWLCLVLLLGGVSPLASAEPGVTTQSGAAEAPIVEVAPERTAVMEMKQSLARFAQERNNLSAENDLLLKQRWLLIFYSVAMSVLAGWLGLRMLSKPPSAKPRNGETNIFPANNTGIDTSVTARRKNATITIRNGATQQPEVVELVQTRKLFNRSDNSSETRPSTARVERHLETHREPQTSEPATVPITQRMERPGQLVQSEKTAVPPEIRTTTVRVDHRSDRLEQVGVKPGTGVITRTKGFSLLEVMISVAVLATVLMAVMSGSYTLRQVQRAAQEQSQIEELSANLAERITGANWDWIGRNRPNEIVNGTTINYKNGAWSWHRREPRWTGPHSARVPLLPLPLHQPLREEPRNGQTLAPNDNLITVGLLEEKTGIENLSVYLEYYRTALLHDVFDAGAGQAPNNKWRQYAPSGITDETPQLINENIYPQSENIFDLREEDKAIIVRIIVTWQPATGGNRRHELVFARRK